MTNVKEIGETKVLFNYFPHVSSSVCNREGFIAGRIAQDDMPA